VPKRGVFAEALGVSPRTISTYCQVAQDDGYLELLKPGSLRFRLADEFVFHFPPSADAGAPSAGEVPNTFAESTTCGIATSHRVSTSHKVLANCKTAPPNK
jgi:hypothetical protein